MKASWVAYIVAYTDDAGESMNIHLHIKVSPDAQSVILSRVIELDRLPKKSILSIYFTFQTWIYAV